MADLNIKEIADANPITTILGTDLIYLGRSPYGITDDRAILASDAGIAGFTSGSILFANVSGNPDENNSNLFWDNTNNVLRTRNLGLGQGISGSLNSIIDARVYAGNPIISCSRVNGSVGTESAVLNGNLIGGFGARGYGTDTFGATQDAFLSFTATENWTNSAHGCGANIGITPNGSITRMNVINIDQSGSVGIRTTTYGGVLSVSLNQVIDSSPTPAQQISINPIYTVTGAASTSIDCIRSIPNFDCTNGNLTGTYSGIVGMPLARGTNTITSMIAVNGNIRMGGSTPITVTNGSAFVASSWNLVANSTITNYRGFQTGNVTWTDATNLITNYYHFFGTNVTGAGVITNQYGLFLQNMTKGTTLNYAIYSEGGQSYHVGNFGLNVAVPLNKLDVNGAVAIGAFAGISTAPSNGLAVSGSVGIGTSSVTAGNKVQIAIDSTNNVVTATGSNSGGTNSLIIQNTSNTASSNALCEAVVAGSSANDPFFRCTISGGPSFSWGIDNSTTNNDFVISASTTLGISNVLSIDGVSNNITVLQNLLVNGDISTETAGKTLKIKEGSNACKGTGATLVGGTVTVNTTAIAAGDQVIITKTAAGGTPGFITITISAVTSFTLTSSSALDTSTFSWFILKPA